MPLTVYKSSAGSGKTFTLVLEYLKLVLNQPGYYRNILAVTFTNKAANEMKTRVLKTLSSLSSLEESTPKSQQTLIDILHADGYGREAISEGAFRTFHGILHHYNDFHIGTLDAFSHRIVQTFTRDLGLPSQFEVELEAKLLVKRLISELIKKVGVDSYVTQILLRFLMDNIEDERQWRLDVPLENFAAMLLPERTWFELNSSPPLSQDEFYEARTIIHEEVRSFEQSIKEQAGLIMKLLQHAGITMDDTVGKSKGIWPVLFKLSTNTELAKTLEGKTFQNAMESESPILSPKAGAEAKAAYARVEQAVVEAFEQIKEKYRRDFIRYRLMLLLKPNIYLIGLQSLMAEIMQELIDQTQQVPISEFNKRIATLLHESPVAYIYERLGEKFKSFLLDEFQDTSVLQWQNMLPLLENSLSSGNPNLIVGDGKQSIYRWRGGEYQQFTSLPAIYQVFPDPKWAPLQELIKSSYDERKLNTNYRSANDIVQFNNDFFSYVAAQLPEQLKHVYDECQQTARMAEQSGYVQINFFNDNEQTTDQREQEILEKTLEIIQQCIADGFAYNDIAVLCRTNEDGDKVANYLNSNEIEVVSADSLLLQSAASVRAVIGFLRFHQMPTDEINRLDLLLNLLEIRYKDRDDLVMSYLEDYFNAGSEAQIKQIFELTGDSELLHVGGLYDQVEEVIRLLGLAEIDKAYLQFLLEVVLEFQTRERGSFAAFLKHWQRISSEASLVIPEAAPAVRVMTIHKAKGLEFPVVIYPFANSVASGHSSEYHWVDLEDHGIGSLKRGLIRHSAAMMEVGFSDAYETENQKKLLDLVNLLYVALTRPEMQLFILSAQAREVSVYSLLKGYLSTIGLWDEQVREYRFGKKTLEIKKEPVSEALEANYSSCPSRNWANSIRIAPLRVIDESSSERELASQRGNLMHELLSNICVQTDADRVLHHYHAEGKIDAEQRLKLKVLFDKLFSNKYLASYFSEPSYVKNEAEVVDEHGNLYRLDRYVVMKDHVAVLEYKTGLPDESHKHQLEKYLGLVGNLQSLPAKGFLVYLAELQDIAVVEL